MNQHCEEAAERKKGKCYLKLHFQKQFPNNEKENFILYWLGPTLYPILGFILEEVFRESGAASKKVKQGLETKSYSLKELGMFKSRKEKTDRRYDSILQIPARSRCVLYPSWRKIQNDEDMLEEGRFQLLGGKTTFLTEQIGSGTNSERGGEVLSIVCIQAKSRQLLSGMLSFWQ